MNISLLQSYQHLYRQGNLPVPISSAPFWFSNQVDEWIASAARAILGPDPTALLLAVGGYGRQSLFPFSDLDLCLLVPEDHDLDLEGFAQSLFLPLWDAGFDVGHGIRTMSETVVLASQDFEVLCSLLDARLIYGDFRQFEDFQREFSQSVIRPCQEGLAKWLSQRFKQRHQSRSGSTNLVTPNLKEGRGGLRDAQTIGWLTRISSHFAEQGLQADERETLRVAEKRLTSARIALHRLSQRKNDVLHLELQPEVASFLGYEHDAKLSSVELFLSDLHRAMSDITLCCRYSIAQIASSHNGCDQASDHGLDVSFLASDPVFIFQLIRHSALTGSPLSWQVRRLIQAKISAQSFPDHWAEKCVRYFEDILCAPHAAKALEQMLEVGLLAAFIPEFAPVEHFVQFDSYHQLPVGFHMIETVRQLSLCAEDREFIADQFVPLAQNLCLRWAALLHDIGKTSSDHCRHGAALATDILQRFGYDAAFTAQCSFLISEHLLLIHGATRHDLGEEGVIVTLAQSIGSVDRLDMLTLLTWADSRATGPKAWTPWIRNLVREAYFKIRRMLESDLQCGEHLVQRLARVRDCLRSQRPDHYSVSEFERFLSVMPARYLLQTNTGRILEHVRLVEAFRDDPSSSAAIVWDHKPRSDSMLLTIVAHDQPGFFALVCTVLGRFGFSVYGAELNVWDDGTIVDVFWISEPLDPLYADQTMERFADALQRLIADDDYIEAIDVHIPSKRKNVFPHDGEMVHVVLDNGSSDFHTVLTIEAPDVGGLLSAVSVSLFRLGLDLVFAKIATQKDKAMDIFHIRRDGEKLPDQELSAVEAEIRLLVCSLYV